MVLLEHVRRMIAARVALHSHGIGGRLVVLRLELPVWATPPAIRAEGPGGVADPLELLADVLPVHDVGDGRNTTKKREGVLVVLLDPEHVVVAAWSTVQDPAHGSLRGSGASCDGFLREPFFSTDPLDLSMIDSGSTV